MGKKPTSIICYFGLIGWLIAVICGSRKESKGHLEYTAILMIASALMSVLLITAGGGLAAVIVKILAGGLSLCWVIGLLVAIFGKSN